LLLLGVAGTANAGASAAPERTWGVNGRVLAILPVGARIFVGGTFTAVVDPTGISRPVSNLAVFARSTGVPDLSFDAQPSGTVTSLATDGTSLFIGGAFSTVSSGEVSYARTNAAAVSLTTGSLTSWRPAVRGGQVDALAYSAATRSVYLGGNFTSVTDPSKGSSPVPYLASVSASSGQVNVGFAPTPNARVRSINVAVNGSGLYIGGDFTSVGGRARTKSLARVTLTTGTVDPSFRPAATNQGAFPRVYDITSDKGQVYVAVGGAGGACTALTATSGSPVWSKHTNGNVQAVRLIAATAYCGGHFGGAGSFDGLTRYKLGAVDTASGTVLSFAPRVNAALGVWAIGTQVGDTTLCLGGDFSKISGVAQPHFAMFAHPTG